MPTTTPSELLPCEHALLPALQVLAAAEDGGDHASRDAALVAVLREHPFVKVSKSEARAEAGAPVVAGEGLILQSAEHFRTNVRAFNKWLKTHEGKPYAKQAGGPSDDGLYTVSAVLRRCLPRGLSLFTFAAAGSESAGGVEAHVLVRGFRKFTGLTDEDEDEESAAARQNESFLYSQAAAERFAITTKANGENGKFMVHDVKGTPVLFAGSKNTCFAWRGDADVTAAFPAATSQAGAYVPGPRIAAAMQQIWQGWSQEEQKDFCRQAQGCSIMLEFMGTSNEHIFPIDCDFVQFVAVLDAEGLPWPQQRAVELFDAFKMPRVRCEAGIPIAELPGRLAAERAAVDREGVVIYLETARGEAVGLVKCKSDYYVKARRTRQILWSALVEPLLRGDEVDVPVKANGRGQGWAAAEARMRTGMCNLRHVPGCGDHWEQWAAEAVSFVRWWRAKFEAAEAQGKDARERELERAKSKFGSLYRQFREDYRPDPQ